MHSRWKWSGPDHFGWYHSSIVMWLTAIFLLPSALLAGLAMAPWRSIGWWLMNGLVALVIGDTMVRTLHVQLNQRARLERKRANRREELLTALGRLAGGNESIVRLGILEYCDQFLDVYEDSAGENLDNWFGITVKVASHLHELRRHLYELVAQVDDANSITDSDPRVSQISRLAQRIIDEMLRETTEFAST